MTPNVCQTDRLAETNTASLCTSCKMKDGCIWKLHIEHVGRDRSDGLDRVQIVDSCQFFEDDGKGHSAFNDMRYHLFESKIRDLCAGCPSAVDETCQRRRDLDKVTRTSLGYSAEPGWVHVSVVTCRPKFNGLYQISEPRK